MLAAMRRASSSICRCMFSLPSQFRLRRWTELTIRPLGSGEAGGSCYAWGDARPNRALSCIDCYAGFARARYSYQPHTMRTLRAVAYLPNELQVTKERLGRPVQILKYLLAFCVWLGWMYLMAIINDALFAIFLGSSMIMGGIYIPPGNASKIQLNSIATDADETHAF
jgi:hypothetical protein